MLEVRALGKTGLKVSEIGLSLAGETGRVQALARRAAAGGVRLFHVDEAGLVDAVRSEGAVVAAPEGGDLAVRSLADIRGSCGDPKAVARCADAGDVGLALAMAGGMGGVLVPFNAAQQGISELLSRLGRSGLGVIGVSPLAGGAFGGREAPPPVGPVVKALRSLATPRRTLAQVAIQFALANSHLHAVLVRVSSEGHLEEAITAPEAEPLSVADLERIFEVYAHRFDDDPSKGCGNRR